MEQWKWDSGLAASVSWVWLTENQAQSSPKAPIHEKTQKLWLDGICCFGQAAMTGNSVNFRISLEIQTGNSDPPPGHHPSLLPEPPSPLLYTKKDLQRWRKGFAAPRATKEQLCQVPKVLPHSQPCSSPSHTEFPQCWWLKGSPILYQRNHFIEQVLGSFLSCWSYHGSVSIWSFSIPYVLNNCISTPADIWLLQFICKHD